MVRLTFTNGVLDSTPIDAQCKLRGVVKVRAGVVEPHKRHGHATRWTYSWVPVGPKKARRWQVDVSSWREGDYVEFTSTHDAKHRVYWRGLIVAKGHGAMDIDPKGAPGWAPPVEREFDGVPDDTDPEVAIHEAPEESTAPNGDAWELPDADTDGASFDPAEWA